MIKSDNLVEATILALQGKLPLTETKKLPKSKKLKKENVDVIVNKEDNSTYVETPDTIVTVADKDTIEDTSTDVSTQTPDVLEVPVDSDETIVPEQDLPDDTVQDIVDSDETIVPEEDLPDSDEEPLKIESKETEGIDDNKDNNNEDNKEVEQIKDLDEAQSKLDQIADYIDTYTQEGFDEDSYGDFKQAYTSLAETIRNCAQELHNIYYEGTYNGEHLRDQDDEDLQEAKKLRRSVRENKGKFDSKSFNEVFTKYFTQKYPNLKESKVTKLGVSKNGLKIEGVLINKADKQKTICLEMKKVNNSNTFSKYQVVESKGLLRESKDKSKTLNLMIHNKNNVLECKYLVQK